jgi:predicted GIY-YIG superfamily endonuclease
MKATKFFQPYIKPGKCTLQKTGAGTYIIAKNGKYLYIGYSETDVKKTMYRHFQEWNDKTQYRVVYKNLKDIVCRVIFTTPGKAQKLEQALILKHKPRDNEQKLDLYTEMEKQTIVREYNLAKEEDPF